MLDSYRDLIDELLGTPTVLRGLIGAGDQPLSPTLASLIAELRDRDRWVLGRLQAMTRQRTPVLRGAVPRAEAAPEELTALLDDFDTARGDLVSLLMNLTLKDWERTAIDEAGSEVAVTDEVENHVEFDEDHVARIREALANA